MTAATEAGTTKPKALLKRLGPGLITGAADDDPSGIATYSQAGAQFGFGLIWTIFLTYPLMVAVQMVAARVGRVTGRGLAANLGEVLPRWAVLALVALLFVANTINIGADIAAMGAAGALLVGGGAKWLTMGFAAVSLCLQMFVPYHRYVRFLKWLTLALFAYVGVVFTVRIPWAEVARSIVLPHLTWSQGAVMLVVAVFGTTISPYLFFWQSSEEVEELEKGDNAALVDAPKGEARKELRRIRWDTFAGMGVSNLIAFFIILTTAVTLNAHGQHNVESAAQAAEALRPVAGPLAFALFSLGIIGTGMLATPVLAGSTAYAIGEAGGWTTGLEKKPREAKAFYAVITVSMVLAVGVVFAPVDPMRALVVSAVINGVAAVPIMAAMMLVAGRKALMGDYAAGLGLKVLGWAATGVMAAAVAAMAAAAVL